MALHTELYRSGTEDEIETRRTKGRRLQAIQVGILH